MARNWKKAHDQEKAARELIEAQHSDLESQFATVMRSRILLEGSLGKALTLALGAAENLEAQGKRASATALRDAVEVLNPKVSR